MLIPTTSARKSSQATEHRSTIKLKRVYDAPAPSDGVRILVERLWLGHDPARWDDFRLRYAAELDANPTAWQPIVEAADQRIVTLLFSSHDVEHNNAVALKVYLDTRSQSRAGSRTRRDVPGLAQGRQAARA